MNEKLSYFATLFGPSPPPSKKEQEKAVTNNKVQTQL